MGEGVEAKELTRAEQYWKGDKKVASMEEEAPVPALKSRKSKIKTVGGSEILLATEGSSGW